LPGTEIIWIYFRTANQNVIHIDILYLYQTPTHYLCSHRLLKLMYTFRALLFACTIPCIPHHTNVNYVFMTHIVILIQLDGKLNSSNSQEKYIFFLNNHCTEWKWSKLNENTSWLILINSKITLLNMIIYCLCMGKKNSKSNSHKHSISGILSPTVLHIINQKNNNL